MNKRNTGKKEALKITGKGKLALFFMVSPLWRYSWYKEFVGNLLFGKEKVA